MKNIKILLVEHQSSVSPVVSRLVARSKDLEIVATANDGKEAAALASIHQPQVIIMEVSLPLLDGIQVTRIVKTKLPQTKILILTSQDSDDYIFGALAAGADGYGSPQLSEYELELAIRSIISGAIWLDATIGKRLLELLQQPSYGKRDPSSFKLTNRELQVLRLIIDGKSNAEISDVLYVGVETVKTHISNIMYKLSVADRTQAAVKAIRHGLTL